MRTKYVNHIRMFLGAVILQEFADLAGEENVDLFIL